MKICRKIHKAGTQSSAEFIPGKPSKVYGWQNGFHLTWATSGPFAVPVWPMVRKMIRSVRNVYMNLVLHPSQCATATSYKAVILLFNDQQAWTLDGQNSP